MNKAATVVGINEASASQNAEAVIENANTISQSTSALGGGKVADLPGALQAPHSVAAEQALLGAIMVNNRLYDDLAGTLQPSHFYVPLNASIFEAIEKIVNRGREANPITVREMLRNTPFDDDSQLFPHLTAMFENAGLANDLKSLSEVIHTTYLQRQMMVLGRSLTNQASTASQKEDVTQVLDGVSGELFKLAETGVGTNTTKSLRTPLLEVIAQAERAHKDGSGIAGVTTGLVDVDEMIGGLHKSDLVILAARPSMGKSSLAINIAQNAARRQLRNEPNGAAVAVFTLEMSAEQMAARILSSAAGVSTAQLTNGHMTREQFERLVPAASELAELPMYFDDTPQLTVNALRARARMMKRQYGIGLIVVDYLQLMSAPGKGDNRVQEISEISQGLKVVARELNVPVIALSQLSRAVESRDNKRPQLSDLRESGSIEQDADMVLFLYREEYYLQRQLGAESNPDLEQKLEAARGKAELLVSKNRKGSTGAVRLMFHAETTTFHNMAKGFGDDMPEY